MLFDDSFLHEVHNRCCNLRPPSLPPAFYWMTHPTGCATATGQPPTQAEDGGLYDGGNFYTSVYYPAKSLMDLADCLATVKGRENDAKDLQPHITACMADLLSRGDNIGTEVAAVLCWGICAVISVSVNP